jgi:hypothetical protein
MTLQMKLAGQIVVFSMLFVAFHVSLGKDESMPIVDVRFEAPYQQIVSSMGDEWAPTWARDDVLYTSNDDGTSFGGIESNAITFGKLQGADPYRLKGTTINGMADFQEPVVFGPEAAGWQTLETYPIGGVRYRFTACGTAAPPSDSSCLARSNDQGKSWKTITDPGKSPARDGRFSAPSFISYGEMEALYGGEPGEYVYASSYAGVVNGRDNYVVGRVAKVKLLTSTPTDWSFQQPDGSWGPLEKAGPFPNTSYLGSDGANWKTMNTYAVDGVLYMFVTRCVYPWKSSDPRRRHVWQNASVIKSTDGGKTWTRPAADNYARPMFPGRRFGAPYFVWYGKDGAASVDNADKYVYAVSNNGFFENGDDYVLGRVPRSKLPDLSAPDWSFYRGGNAIQDASWTPSLQEAKPILLNRGHSSMTGMTYIPALGRYVMVAWHYHRDNFEQAIKDKDLGTVLEFFEASKPWGPWNKFKEFDTGRLGWYTPIIGQRFQTVSDDGMVKAFLYVTGFTSKPEGGLDPTLYKLDFLPITLSTKPLAHRDPIFVGAK